MNTSTEKNLIQSIVKLSRYILYISLALVVCIVMLVIVYPSTTARQMLLAGSPSTPDLQQTQNSATPVSNGSSTAASATAGLAGSPIAVRSIPTGSWVAPDTSTIPQGKEGKMIRYGRKLIVHTAKYLGPNGSVAHLANKMNCQNCHLEGGSKLFGNNYASFMASYPKMSGRSGEIEPASQRLVECFQRSLAGKAPDTSKLEIQSILAYMKWMGKDVKRGAKLFGDASENLTLLDQAADPIKGKAVFLAKCQSCHGQNGQGQLSEDKNSYINPPLWGKESFNDGAGMYRLTNMAGYVKNNMPNGATYLNPQLTDEEAWDVAAFVNSQPRTHKDQSRDWLDLQKKPMDFPFGPYADSYSEKQHKFGPFKPIREAQKKS